MCRSIPASRTPSRRVYRTFAVLGLSLVCLSAIATSQDPNIRFRHLSVDDGLPHNMVYSIRQQSSGLMWFATPGGLVRFDGFDFTHFDHRPFAEQTPSSSDGSFVYEDRSGVLWFGTWGGGMERFDPVSERFTHIKHDEAKLDTLSDDRVQTIFEDRQGRLWIGTFSGLNRFISIDDGKARFERFLPIDGDPTSIIYDRVWAISQAADDALWVGTDKGLERFDPETGIFEHFVHDPDDPRSLSNDEVRFLTHDRQGTLWVGTQAGLNRFDQRSLDFDRFVENPADPTALANDSVNAILEDRSGSIWIGTQFGGLHRMDPVTGLFTRFQPDPSDPWSVSHHDIRCLWEDESRILWIGTRGGGIDMLELEPPIFKTFAAEPLQGIEILAVTTDRAGRIWIGTRGGGLVRLDKSGALDRHFRHDPDDPSSLSNDQVQALMVDRQGKVWVGTRGGVDAYSEESDEFEHLDIDVEGIRNLEATRIQALAEGHDGMLWIGSRAGLVRWDPASGSDQRWPHRDGDDTSLADDFIWSLLVDHHGRVWVGTDVGGLDLFDPKSETFSHYRHDANDRHSISDDRVRSLWEHHDGSIWVGSHHGLNRLDPASGKFDHYFEVDGLPNATVHSVLGDDSGHLWVSTNRGLARIDPSNRRVRSFDIGDGLQGWLFSSASSHRSSDGRLFFGGLEGLNAFDPSRIGDTDRQPKLVLTGFRIFNKPAQLDAAINYVDLLELDYRDNFITFEFAALDYSRPVTHEYAYRLVGFDDDWIESGDRRSATYTNLDPGAYTFRVRSSTRLGVWNDDELEIALSIAPPVWKTLWFRLSLGLAALLLFLGIERYHQLQQKRLARLVRERTAQLARSTDHLQLLNQATRLINQHMDLGEVLQSIVDGASEVLGAEAAVAFATDSETNLLGIRATFGRIHPNFRPSFDEIAAVEAELILDTREVAPNILFGQSRSRLFGELSDGGRAVPLLVLRIEIEEIAAGLLVFASEDRTRLELNEIATLENLYDHIVSAFQKAAMLDELRDLNRRKNQFLGIAAHDLRTPLGGILGYATLLSNFVDEERFDKELWRRFLDHIGASARSMQALIEDLLDVAAIETGRLDVDLKTTPLRQILEELATTHSLAAEEKGIQFVSSLAENDELIAQADSARISEVIDNLLANAIKFTFPGGKVLLAAGSDDKHVEVQISDTGQGLGPDELEQVFSGKRLGPRPTGGESSTGLGLLIVKKIIDLHEGKIDVVSTKGRGSTFTVSLPREGAS